MWEAVSSHHEEGEPGWEGTDSSIEAGGVAALLLCCLFWLWSRAMLFAVLYCLCVARACTALGHSAQGCAGSWHPWAE